MSSASKRKGSSFEREVVNRARAAGITAKRAYASNGLSIGEAENVDVLIGRYRGQCKIRKRLSSVIKVEENNDVQIIREDRGKTYVVMELDNFLNLIKEQDAKPISQ